MYKRPEPISDAGKFVRALMEATGCDIITAKRAFQECGFDFEKAAARAIELGPARMAPATTKAPGAPRV